MKNPICSILWRDAAYSFKDYNRENLPKPVLTVGFIVEVNKEQDYTKIASSVHIDEKTGKLIPNDGFLIPNKCEISFNKISNLNDE